MKKVNVTEMEKQFIDALIQSLYAEPGFSDVEIQDIAGITLYPINVCKGILGSLVKKGLCYVNDDPAFSDIIYLPCSLYHMHPEWKACTISEESVELNLIKKLKTMKTYIVDAFFEHTVTFKVKAKSEEEAKKLVEENRFGIQNTDEYDFEDGDFGALLGIIGVTEVGGKN